MPIWNSEEMTMKAVVPSPIIGSESADSDNLAADSTGVKWTGEGVVKIDPQNVDSALVRASWTATETDSVTAIEVYDEDATNVLGSVSGNTGTDVEGTVSGFAAGNAVTARANITAASATSGSTVSLDYAIFEVTYIAS